jgi:hypothetical protein
MDEGLVAGFVPLVSPRKASFLMLKLLKFIDVGFIFTLFAVPRPTADFLRADIIGKSLLLPRILIFSGSFCAKTLLE